MDSLRDNSVEREPHLRLVSDATEALTLAPVKAATLRLDRNASLDDALAQIFTSCLDQFTGNWPSFRAAGHPESVHQMRVALRRLRAAAGLVKRGYPCAELTIAAARAKSIAAKLGETRDWDVFHGMLAKGPREAWPGEPSFYALIDAVELRRAQSSRAARETIDSAQTAAFAAELRGVIRRRAWSRAGDSTARGSAHDFAKRALSRLRRQALKRCKGLAERPAPERHEARIALKKARYAAEFFGSLFDEPARGYQRALSKLQESLGADTDMEMASRLLDAIDASEGAKTMAASGFSRGWWAHAQRAGVAKAKKSDRALRKLRPFWT